MTYNVFSGTLNPTQSINQSGLVIDIVCTDSQTWTRENWPRLTENQNSFAAIIHVVLY